MACRSDCFANAADYPPSTSQCTTRRRRPDPAAVGRPGTRRLSRLLGTRPRSAAGTAPPTTSCRFSRLNESIEQWTNVFGLSQTPTSATLRSRAGPPPLRDASGTVQVEAYSISGAGHTLPMSGHGASSDPVLRPHVHSADQQALRPPPPSSPPPLLAPTSSSPTHADHPQPPTTSPPPTTAADARRLHKIGEWNGGFQGEVRQ
jgi:hypothetical protein